MVFQRAFASKLVNFALGFQHIILSPCVHELGQANGCKGDNGGPGEEVWALHDNSIHRGSQRRILGEIPLQNTMTDPITFHCVPCVKMGAPPEESVIAVRAAYFRQADQALDQKLLWQMKKGEAKESRIILNQEETTNTGRKVRSAPKKAIQILCSG